MKTIRIGLIIMLLIGLVGAVSAANLIANGGFEAPIVTKAAGWDKFPSGTSGLEWTVEWYDGSISYGGQTRPAIANLELHRPGGSEIPSGWLAAVGSQYAELDTDWDGPGGGLSGEPASVDISQSVTTSGQCKYVISYSWSPRPDRQAGSPSSQLEVFWNDVSIAAHSATGNGATTQWSVETKDVVGIDDTSTLKFRETGTADSYGMFLDDVSVEEMCIDIEKEGPEIAIVRIDNGAIQSFRYTYTVTNPGDLLLENIMISDLVEYYRYTTYPSGEIESVLIAPVYDSGDTNEDDKLDPCETWTYYYDFTFTKLPQPGAWIYNTAEVSGSYDGISVTDTDEYHLKYITVRKAVLLYWDSKNYQYPDSTEFPVDFYLDGEKILSSMISKDKPHYLVVSEGEIRYKEPEEDFPEGYTRVWPDGGKCNTGAPSLGPNPGGCRDDSILNLIEFDLALEKSGPVFVEDDGDAVYTFTVTNAGPAVVTPVVHDEFCTPIYVSGDSNANEKIEPDETWEYTCTVTADWARDAEHCNLAWVEDQELLDYFDDDGAAWGFYKGGDVNGRIYEYGDESWDFSEELLLTTNNWDEYCLIPFTLRKEVFVYWDSANTKFYDQPPYSQDDTTEFDVDIKKDGTIYGTVQISRDSPAFFWLGEASESDPVQLVEDPPEGYEAGYDGVITWYPGRGNDWTFPNVILFNLKLEKSGPAYAHPGETITYTYEVTNDGPASVVPEVYDQTVEEYASYQSGDTNENDLIDPCETWIFTLNYMIPSDTPIDTTITNTACVAEAYEPESGWYLGGDTNSEDDCDDWTVTILPESKVTTSSLCEFDTNTEVEGQQFRLIFTPDYPSGPDISKLSASNPGQFYYNVFFTGIAGDEETFTITLPEEFETQGAVPVHAYSDVEVYSECGIVCYTPLNEITSDISFCDNEITITATVPESGLIYITIHVDFAFKKETMYTPDPSMMGTDADNTNNDLDIFDHTQFVFSVTNSESDTQTIINENVFKRDPGFAGFVLNAGSEESFEGKEVLIYDPDGALFTTVTTDDDGFYFYYYKYKGKPQTWTLVVDGQEVLVPLKANQLVQTDFLI